MRNYDGLQIVKKTFAGIRIGYVVGWWTSIPGYGRRWGGARETKSGNGVTFRSIRNGLIFSKLTDAQEWRDEIEKARLTSEVVFKAAE